jgi:aryl-alcohol dehydrogenase-like predicted oxidoreductase
MHLILGTAQFQRNYGINHKNIISQNFPDEILNTAFSLGIQILDTAHDYGLAHKIIGRNENNFTIHTKVKNIENIEKNLNSILNQLNRNVVDLLYIHDSTLTKFPRDYFNSVLKYKGEKFLELGASIYSLEEFRNCLSLGIFEVIQIPLNVLDRRFSTEIREQAKQRGIKVNARSIFLQGILASESPTTHPQFKEISPQINQCKSIAKEHNLSLLELAMRWIISQNDLESLIFGVDNIDQLRELVKIKQRGPLSNEIIGEIEKINVSNLDLLDPRTWVKD